MPEVKYKRVLLKVSGEALAGPEGHGLDFAILHNVCRSIKECTDLGVQVGVVIGAGNFWRGVKNGAGKLQRSHADAMGMLGTVMNCIAVADVLNQQGVDARVLSAVEMNKFAEYFKAEGMDDVDCHVYRPDKLILCYPVIRSRTKFAHSAPLSLERCAA